MLGRLAAIGLAGAVVLLAILLQITAPATAGPVGVLIVFILIYVSVLGVLTFLLFGISKGLRTLSSPFTTKKPLSTLSLQRSYYFSSVIALAPVLFMGMQSIGGIGVYDIFLVLLFVAIACVYIAKRAG